MTRQSVALYLQTDSKLTGNLLARFNRLKLWNTWLQEALPDEALLLEHCHIVGLDKKSLIVIADNSHWVTRFRFFIPNLLTKLRKYDDFKGIQAICCKVRPLAYRPKQPVRQRLIISDDTAEIVNAAADKIKNEKLKKVLKRLAERDR